MGSEELHLRPSRRKPGDQPRAQPPSIGERILVSAPGRYLFIITRDLSNDPSAQYLLRRALSSDRRGARVTVVLRERALGCLTLQEEQVLVTRLLTSGVRLFAQCAHAPAYERDGVCIPIASLNDGELADLLLDNGVESHWC